MPHGRTSPSAVGNPESEPVQSTTTSNDFASDSESIQGVCGDPFPRQRQLGWMLADQGDAGPGQASDPCAQQAELAVSQDRHLDIGAEFDLFRDPERGGQRFDEDGLHVLDPVGDLVEVAGGDPDEVGHRPVVAEDSQDRPVGTVTRPTGPAGGAFVTGGVDLRRHPASRLGLGDELVAEHPSEIHVAACELQVGIADAHHPHAQG